MKKDAGEIKHLFSFFIDEDFWLYDPKVMEYLRKRFKQADNEYQTGKIKPIEKLWSKIGI